MPHPSDVHTHTPMHMTVYAHHAPTIKYTYAYTCTYTPLIVNILNYGLRVYNTPQTDRG